MAPIRAITTEGAPAAIGPYSQAVEGGGLIFLSGQIPIDPATGEVLQGGITEQSRQVFRNLEAVLSAAGSGFSGVLKCTVYLRDLGDFEALNQVYAEVFDPPHPARATVEVSRLPRDVLVEIDAVALRLDA